MTTKETKIGIIPSEWDIAEMRDAVTVKEGLVDPRVEPYASMPHVGPDNIVSKTGHILPCKIAKDQNLISGKYLFAPNDIVYSKIRPYLRKAIIADFQGVCSADAYPLTAKPGFNTKFLHAVILSNSFSDQATSQQDRTGIPKVNREQLASIVIPRPPENEQEKIGAVIALIRDAIDVQDRRIAAIAELKGATLEQAFTQGLRTGTPQETTIGKIPYGWKLTTLAECCEKPQYGYTASASKDPVGPRFLRITDIEEHGVNWNTVPFCMCDPDREKSFLLMDGDLVFARIGATTGKSHLVENPPRSVFASYLIRMRPGKNLKSRFLAAFFDSPAYWMQVESNQDNNLKGGFSASVLSNFLIPVPNSVDEQEEIGRVIQHIGNLASEAALKRTHLVQLFKSSLDQLTSGSLRTTPLLAG